MKKNRVNLFILSIITAWSSIQTSCSDFLEMPMISSAVNIDTVFSSRAKAEPFLWETYRQIIPSGFPLNGNSGPMHRSIRAAITDECDYSIGWSSATEINISGYVANNSRLMEIDYNNCYAGIRKAFIFMENIDKVSDIPENEKTQMKMECKTLIALRYHTLLRSFGGIPLIKSSISASDDLSKITRSTFEECVNYIVELCDEAINNPLTIDQYPTNWRGRVTRGVAYAIKARTLLYAASPLYNNTMAPPASYGNQNDLLISYMNYDKERWEKAIDANKALLDWAKGPGKISLISTGNPYEDYSVATSKEDNAEIILANKTIGNGANGSDGFTRYYMSSKNIMDFNKGNAILFNGLTKFYKNDGTDQTWPQLNESHPFSEYQIRMHEMEPRLLATAWIFGESPMMCPNQYTWNFNALPGTKSGELHGCAGLLKFCYDYQGESYKEFPVFRLAEFYLNYAEALNEYYPDPPQEAYDALNTIRARAGLPAITKQDSRYNTTEKFRELVHRERFIELFAEDHRIYDCRRWRIAHLSGVIGGPMIAFDLVQNNPSNPTAYTSYVPKIFEERLWMNKLYFHPFPQSEVDKGNLLQNPGY